MKSCCKVKHAEYVATYASAQSCVPRDFVACIVLRYHVMVSEMVWHAVCCFLCVYLVAI